MKNILMCLAFVVVSAMGETNYKIEKNEIEKNLSQEEKFNMLFGKTGLQFTEIRKERESRKSRKTVSTRVETEDKVLELSTLSQDERYELLFGTKVLRARVARSTRFTLPRQARENVYISFRF